MLLRGAHILGLGIAMALSQIVLWWSLGSLLVPNEPLSLLAAWSIIALPFLLFPGIEGFLAAGSGDEGYSGAGGGCLVGFINFVVFVIATFVFIGVECSGYCPAIGQALLVSLVFQVLGSVVGGGLGGWIGGALRGKLVSLERQRARLARQRSASLAAPAAPGEDQ